MAQLVEQLIRNQQVAGPNPASSSKKNSSTFRLENFFIAFFPSGTADPRRTNGYSESAGRASATQTAWYAVCGERDEQAHRNSVLA